MTQRTLVALAAFGLIACDSPGGGDVVDSDTTATTNPGVTDTVTGDDGTNPTDPPADTSSADTTPVTTEIPIVASGCLDGQYTETLPNPDGDISAIVAGYSASDLNGFALDVLDVRYPIGSYLVENALQTSFGSDCVAQFVRQTSRASQVMRQLSTVVHECGHMLDIESAGAGGDVFIIRDDLRFTCTGGDTTDRFGKTFARSLINGDGLGSTNPGDSYKNVYLDGDPTDGNFDGGDQGFNSVLEEATQYVNSLATDYAFRDQIDFGSISARDGILTFLWYIERYLRLARTEYPSAYAFISGDRCHRETILTIWGRAWLYLELTDGMGELGINDDALHALVTDQGLLGEIDRIRDAHGCK